MHHEHILRLIRLVQENGERVVFSLNERHEPVMILPLSAYEQLISQPSTALMTPLLPSSSLPSSAVDPRTSPPAPATSSFNTPSAADSWDSDYDAEQIMAHQRGFPENPPPQRMQQSVNQAAQAYQAFQIPPQRPSPGNLRPKPAHRMSPEDRFTIGE